VLFAVLHFTLQAIPEHNLCREFVRTNDALAQVFGTPFDVQDARSARANTLFGKNDSRKEGHYSFKITGPKDKGEVWVTWRSQGNGKGMEFLEIERQIPWKDSQPIWKSEQ